MPIPVVLSLEEMIRLSPRRYKLGDWDSLHPPRNPGDDWSITLPFRETFKRSYERMCTAPCIGIKETNGRCWTFLTNEKNPNQRPVKVNNWIELISNYVGIRDCLSISFALDYDCIDGNPQNGRTEIGDLRVAAKPYNAVPTDAHRNAAEELGKRMAKCLSGLNCYEFDSVVGTPSSDPTRDFQLTEILAATVSHEIGVDNFTAHVRTKCERGSLKNVGIDQKISTIQDTVAIDDKIFASRKILLLDDLYQSGVTMNYLAHLLWEKGADEVSGLSCVKTCRNSDNSRT